MADFNKAIFHTLEYEGHDVYTDIEGDKGAATKFGISLNFVKESEDLALFDANNDKRLTKEDIQLLTIDKVLEAYKKYFWDISKLDLMSSDKKAFVFFDTTVNHGLRNATKLAQKTLIELGFKIEFDGKFGNATFSAIQSADEEKFISVFLKKRSDFYNAIVKNNPTQKKFLKG